MHFLSSSRISQKELEKSSHACKCTQPSSKRVKIKHWFCCLFDSFAIVVLSFIGSLFGSWLLRVFLAGN